MLKIERLLMIFLAMTVLIPGIIYAQVYNVGGIPVNNTLNPFVIKWSSQSPADIVSFQNGTGAALVIQIMVDNNPTRTGINLTNCGTTSHVDAGSTVVCVTRDARSPVSFVTDNATQPVSGTYIVQILR